jgi:hypothetical protein
MLKEAIEKIISLAAPNKVELGDLTYVDTPLTLVMDPVADLVQVTTLQGLVDLFAADIDAIKGKPVLVHVEDFDRVALISTDSDAFGRRRVWARAMYPRSITPFKFGEYHSIETFIVGLQYGFQKTYIESKAGDLTNDLDYVLKAASAITADAIQISADDGISQKVSMSRGIVLNGTETLKSRVSLSPYRTFAEIDQVLSTFIFRARRQSDTSPVQLALFEADGGRWRIDAVKAIAEWLSGKFKGDKVPAIVS